MTFRITAEAGKDITINTGAEPFKLLDGAYCEVSEIAEIHGDGVVTIQSLDAIVSVTKNKKISTVKVGKTAEFDLQKGGIKATSVPDKK